MWKASFRDGHLFFYFKVTIGSKKKVLDPHSEKPVSEQSTEYSMSCAAAVLHMIESTQTNLKTHLLDFSYFLYRFPYRIIMTDIAVLGLAITIPKTLSSGDELNHLIFSALKA